MGDLYGVRVEDGCLYDGFIFLPMKGLIGLIHDEDGDEHEKTIFEYAEDSSQYSVRPAEMDSSEELRQQSRQEG